MLLSQLELLKNEDDDDVFDEDGDDGDNTKEGWLVTQCSALIGLLTLLLTAGGGLLIRTTGLSPFQSIVLNQISRRPNPLSELLQRKNQGICPRSVINNQMRKAFFKDISS